MDKLMRHVLPVLLALLAGAAAAQEPARIWRVCITSIVVPPYLNDDPMKLGIVERLLIDGGRQVGLNVLLLRYPQRRCTAMMENDSADATLAAPVAFNLERYQFPMKAGAIDAARRVARTNLVWVRRAESALDWNGRNLVGARAETTVVGTRLGVVSATEPLLAMGFKVDDTAMTTRQLLAKLSAQRLDLVVALQEEVEFAMHGADLKPLVVLPIPFLSIDFYVAVRRQQQPELQEKIEAWWTAIGRLRELPEYRNR